MPRVVSDGTFTIYVFADDHNPPHCHTVWDGAQKATSIDLRTLQPMCGDKLPKKARKLIANFATEIRKEWNRLNSKNPV